MRNVRILPLVDGCLVIVGTGAVTRELGLSGLRQIVIYLIGRKIIR